MHRLCAKLRPVAVAAAFATLSQAATAVILVDGAWNTWPGVFPVGPGDTDIGNVGLFIGSGGLGNLLVDGGSLLRSGGLQFGDGGTGTGIGVLDGAGSRIETIGDGFSPGALHRLDVGNWGVGRFTVSGGAVFDGTTNAAACLGQFHYCDTFIGNAAGSDGRFTVTGAGSQAHFLRTFFVGNAAVFHPPVDGFTFGTPGGTTRGAVEVLDGATLRTEFVFLGLGPGGGSPTGRERSFADVTISGPGSVWSVGAGSLEAREAFMVTATHANATARITISNGGVLRFEDSAGFFNGMNLNNNGGRTDVEVTGAGSKIDFTAAGSAVLQVGRRLGSARLEVLDGGVVEGLFYLSIGRDGSFGEMAIDGAGSRVTVGKFAVEAVQGVNRAPGVNIGRNGTGALAVRNGGLLEVVGGAESSANSPHISIGVGAASFGALAIDGAGSLVSIRSASLVPDGGPGEARNPFFSVGYEGIGTLAVTNGGQLVLQGGAVSTAADVRHTSLYVGGRHPDAAGGRGDATVSGAGSAIRVLGADAFIGVGSGAGANGQLNIVNQGLVEATIMNVGRNAVGVLAMDNGTLRLQGQYQGDGFDGQPFGAALSIGNRGGVGVATLASGSLVHIENLGSSGVSLNLGGTLVNPLGDGSLTLTGGSRIELVAAPRLATMSVGRDGSGFTRLRGASTIELGDGSLYVGRATGGDGTMVVSEGSSVGAGWVGIGRNRDASGDFDGGTGTFVLINSTLTANEIVIGTNGFLGGSGTINGAVTNWGIFSVGNSPGTMTINGSFSAGAGSRLILEVQDNDAGGFATDHVFFGDGTAVDLADLAIEFRFLGQTDPNAFKDSGGFDIDTFFGVLTGDGEAELGDDAFDQVRFSARSDAYRFESFSYSAAGGADFVAVPVPEPASYALMLLGLGALGVAARRRQGSVGQPCRWRSARSASAAIQSGRALSPSM